MPLIKFQNLNKYGNWRTRVFYHPTSNYSIKPEGFGKQVVISLFKYEYKDPIIPPHLFISPVDGQKYIIPTWQPVLPETTLNDIEWIKPPIKKEKEISNTWKFKSSSSDSVYKVTQKGINHFKCNCPGVYRSKTKKCKHILQVEKELGL